MICHLQVGGVSPSESESLRPRGPYDINSSGRAGEEKISYAINETGKKVTNTPSSTFCSIQTLKGLQDAQPHWRGQFTESTNSNAILI